MPTIPLVLVLVVVNVLIFGNNNACSADDINDLYLPYRVETEFGREPTRLLENNIEYNRENLAILQFEDFVMSMSMSMSMSMDMVLDLIGGNDPNIHSGKTTSSPAVSSPMLEEVTTNSEEQRSAACPGLPFLTITTTLEVALEHFVEQFHTNVAQALRQALSQHYSICIPQTNAENRVDHDDAIKLAYDKNYEVQLGVISVEGTGRECPFQPASANSCQTADVKIHVFGEEINEGFLPLLISIITTSRSFHESLLSTGVVDVRIQDNGIITEVNEELNHLPHSTIFDGGSHSSDELTLNSVVDARIHDNMAANTKELMNPPQPGSVSIEFSSGKILAIVMILTLIVTALIAIGMSVLQRRSSCHPRRYSRLSIESHGVPSFTEHPCINNYFDQGGNENNHNSSTYGTIDSPNANSVSEEDCGVAVRWSSQSKNNSNCTSHAGY